MITNNKLCWRHYRQNLNLETLAVKLGQVSGTTITGQAVRFWQSPPKKWAPYIAAILDTNFDASSYARGHESSPGHQLDVKALKQKHIDAIEAVKFHLDFDSTIGTSSTSSNDVAENVAEAQTEKSKPKLKYDEWGHIVTPGINDAGELFDSKEEALAKRNNIVVSADLDSIDIEKEKARIAKDNEARLKAEKSAKSAPVANPIKSSEDVKSLLKKAKSSGVALGK